MIVEPVLHQTKSRPFSMHHTCVDPDTDSALYLHCHSEMEFFYLEQGSVRFCVENDEFLLHAGDGIFIPPSLLHSAEKIDPTQKECSFSAFVFSPEMLMDAAPAHCRHYLYPILYRPYRCILALSPSTDWQCRILCLLRGVFSERDVNLEESELMLHGSLLMIWQLLYNHHLSQLTLEGRTDQSYSWLAECISYISTHFTENLSLEDLAKRAGLSEGHFCRLFRRLTGFTPFQYITRKRIAQSCEYLTSTNKKITEIAGLCGYNNISYFNRAFLSLMQETPSGYRKRIQQAP